MSAQEDVSKIDGFVMVGSLAATLIVSKIDGFIMVGTPPAVQHEHLWTDEWTGPAERT